MMLHIFFTFITLVHCSHRFVLLTDQQFSIRDYQLKCYELGYEPTELLQSELSALVPLMEEHKITSAVVGIACTDDNEFEDNETISDALFFDAHPDAAYPTALLTSIMTRHTIPHEITIKNNEPNLTTPKTPYAKNIICKIPRKHDATYDLLDELFQKLPGHESELIETRNKKQSMSVKRVRKDLEESIERSKMKAEWLSGGPKRVAPSKDKESPSSVSSDAFTESSFGSSVELSQWHHV